MRFLECDLEEIIMKTNNQKLRERGLNIEGHKISQLSIGNYGRADVLTLERNYRCEERYTDPYLNIGVYELKKDNISVSAFFQAIRYAKGIQDWIKTYKKHLPYSITINLVGSVIDMSGDVCYLADLFQNEHYYPTSSVVNINLYTYAYDFDGINFKTHEGYFLTEKGF